MSIEAKCPGCDRLLRVADETAGKQARCPVCSTVYTVPLQSEVVLSPNSATAAGSAAPTDEIIIAADAVPAVDTSAWSMKTPEGQTYGPVTRVELDRWVADGRVTADCELRADSGDWQTADRVYVVLKTPPPFYTPAPINSPGNLAFPAGNVYSAAAAGGASSAAGMSPHRGLLILVLALMGFIITCPLMSISAWVMGANDLREMREGRMDPEGQGATQAGYMLGMLLSLAWIAIAVIGLFVMLFIAARGG